MLGLDLASSVFSSFLGTIIALFIAGGVWLFKSAASKHRSQVRALQKYEIALTTNLTFLKDNFEFLHQWVESLKNHRPYSYHFSEYVIEKDEIYKIDHRGLVNRIIALNYMLQRTSLDFNNIYKSYWDNIAKLIEDENEATKTENIKRLNDNVREALEGMEVNYEPIKNDIIRTMALIRAVGHVRYHSLFGYLGVLFRDIYPNVTDEKVEQEIKKLEADFNKIVQGERAPLS